MSSAKIMLVAHDAGGAEMVSSWALSHPGNAYRFHLGGPALAIFQSKLGGIENLDASAFAAAFESDPPDLLLTGTSWQSDLERHARALARGHHVRTAAYLDHWVNYPERFGNDWRENLPDEIWCPDRESLAICGRDGFPADRLVLKGNPYLDDLVAKMSEPAAAVRKGSLLYVCEPIREHMEKAHGNPMHLGYDEFSALRNFFETVMRWSAHPTRIVVRPHPSEDRAKYDAIIDGFRDSLRAERSAGAPLAVEIQEAEMVAGCESMALVVALNLGKTVFTSIPPQGPPCRLPFKAIRRIDAPGLFASVGHK